MADENQANNPEENAAQPDEAPQQAPVAPEASNQAGVSKDAMNMALLCHILAIFTGFLGPLILWIIKKDDSPFIDEHGKEALNFQLTVLIGYVIGGILTFLCIGFFVMMAVWIGNLIFCILAAVKASKGEHYRYPMCIRFIK